MQPIFRCRSPSLFVGTQELLHLNLVKGVKESLHHKTFMGRQAVLLRNFADNPGQEVDDWYDLGKGEYSSDLGPVLTLP